MKKQIKFGDEFKVEFIANKDKSKKPIAKIEGITCFVHYASTDWLEPESIWMVKVVDIKERCLIIDPLVEVMEASENRKNKMQLLANFKQPKKENSKIKKSFPYMSKNECLAVSSR